MPFQTYGFISTGGLADLEDITITYLQVQRCLHVPSRPILGDFMRQYFRYVHPLLPLIDEASFWNMFYRFDVAGDEPASFSLLVFQAMVFVSCSVRNHTPYVFEGQNECAITKSHSSLPTPLSGLWDTQTIAPQGLPCIRRPRLARSPGQYFH